jgi:hypothetical protein
MWINVYYVKARRLPPPGACFVVKDGSGQKLG